MCGSNYRGDHDRLLRMDARPSLDQGADRRRSAFLVRHEDHQERRMARAPRAGRGRAGGGRRFRRSRHRPPVPELHGPGLGHRALFRPRRKKYFQARELPAIARTSRANISFRSRRASTARMPHLSAWPAYFGRSSVLFGRTVDVACGSLTFCQATASSRPDGSSGAISSPIAA